MRTRTAAHWPARLIVFVTALFPIAYIIAVGIQKFLIESFGTWLLSPVIYQRILPAPLGHSILYLVVKFPILCDGLCAIPVLLLGVAGLLSISALCDGSVLKAGIAFWLVSGVFIIYHHLQPFGMSYYAMY